MRGGVGISGLGFEGPEDLFVLFLARSFHFHITNQGKAARMKNQLWGCGFTGFGFKVYCPWVSGSRGLGIM